MANDIAHVPLKLDTAGLVFEGSVKFKAKSVRWVSKNASAGNEVILHDASGRVLFHSVAAGANHLDVERPESRWIGLTVNKIDSGIIYIEM